MAGIIRSAKLMAGAVSQQEFTMHTRSTSRARLRALRNPPALITLTLLGCLVTTAGCDDPPLDVSPTAADGASYGEIVGGDVSGNDATTADGTAADGATVDQDAGLASDALSDTSSASGDTAIDGTQVTDGGQPLDTGLPPFAVVSHTPPTGTHGLDRKFTFDVTFNRDVKAISIQPMTVLVRSNGDKPISGVFKVLGETVTFEAKSPAPPSSRVDVTFTILVQAQLSGSLTQPYTFHFYTRGFEDTQRYEGLAARYAPNIRMGTAGTGKADHLRAIDYDGNWDPDDNVSNLSKKPALGSVAWTVAETQSHTFLHYVFYWPNRVGNDSVPGHRNDTAGATVVVERYPVERPVALLTWFKASSDEQMWLWVTKESGIVANGAKPGSMNIRGVLDEAALFPPAEDAFGCDTEGAPAPCKPRRYPAFLAASSHQSCLWSDAGESIYHQCETWNGALANTKQLRYLPGPVASEASGAGAAPDAALPVVTYALQSLADSWLVHRGEAGKATICQEPLTYVYAPPDGRPGGDGTVMGSKLRGLEADSDYGRPPWAWAWKPVTGVSFYMMPRGTPFLDPAWALLARLGGEGAVPAWDAQAKTGMSLAYCFNPALLLDNRNNAGCKAP